MVKNTKICMPKMEKKLEPIWVEIVCSIAKELGIDPEQTRKQWETELKKAREKKNNE